MINIFNIPIDESRLLIYSPLKKTAFIGNHSLADIVMGIISTSETDSGGNKPQDKGFLKFLDERKLFLPEDIPSDEHGISGVRYDTVILFLTNQCNLRCRYCYAHSGEHSPKTMSWETAKTAIDFAWRDSEAHGLKEFTLGFHGRGEPTENIFSLLRGTAKVKYSITPECLLRV